MSTIAPEDSPDAGPEGPRPPRRVQPRKKRQVRYIVAAALCGVAVIALLVLGLRGNIEYYRSVSEGIKQPVGQRFRLAGAVIPKTVHDDGKKIVFQVTDGKKTVEVDHSGDEPPLFRTGVSKGESVPVVVEGKFNSHRVFMSDRILIRHGNNYAPPKVNTNKAPKKTGA
ncbi:MAG: cytochrome c-type biosis protein CcmE [Actinomycetia bacterium]|nr:cytochrome c-type biosis protein CcmE [Actinomycetes bacterium]